MARNKYKLPTPRFTLAHVKADDALIVLRFTYRGKRLVYSTGEKVDPKYWIKDKERAKSAIRGRSDYVALNKRLNQLSEAVLDIYIEYNYGDISPEDYRKELAYRTGRDERPTDQSQTLFGFLRQFIDEQKGSAKADSGRYKHFTTLLNRLQSFSEETGRELGFDNIDWNFKQQFEQWLYQPPRSLSTNTAGLAFKLLRQVLREAQRRKLHSNTIFDDRSFSIRSVKTTSKVHLTKSEIEQLAALDLSDNPRLERVRDLFLVGCNTGLRFSDWHKVNASNIVIEHKRKYLEVVTKKTKTFVKIPLLPAVEKVLEKYGHELPKISSQKFNKYIKEVCELAIKGHTFLRVYSEGGKLLDERFEKCTMLSSHAARKSFATNFYLDKHPVQDLMKILGHATEKQFFEYIDRDASEAAERVGQRHTDNETEKGKPEEQ